jgi:hypothetical protein
MRLWLSWLVGLALASVPLAGCHKSVSFNPALAAHVFPLRTGLTWTYQVTYPNGAHETIGDRVVKAGTLRTTPHWWFRIIRVTGLGRSERICHRFIRPR